MNFSIITDNIDYLLVGAYPNGPLQGLALTLILSVLSAVFSGLIGLVSGILLVMSSKAVESVLMAIIGFFRAIPVLLLILWIYFLLPIAFQIQAPSLLTVVIALSLIGGAYLGHAVAVGLRSIGEGQWAAGLALGFNRWQVLWYLVLPQALPKMAPSFINQCISLMKDTSLGYIIGSQDFFYLARQVDGRLTGAYSTEIYLFVGCVYFIFCSLLDFAANRVAARYTVKPAH